MIALARGSTKTEICGGHWSNDFRGQNVSKSNDGLGLIEAAMDRIGREEPISAAEREAFGPKEFDSSHTVHAARRGEVAFADPSLVTYGLRLAVFLALVIGVTGFVWRATRSADSNRVEAAVGVTDTAMRQMEQSEPARKNVAIAPSGDVPATRVGISAPSGTASAHLDEARGRELIEQWRQDWAARNIEAYLSWYGPDFRPANGQSRSAWAAARRKKLSSQPEIVVRVYDVRFKRSGKDHLEAEFLQDYASGSYQETARRKSLLMARVENDWRIVEEAQNTRQSVVAP